MTSEEEIENCYDEIGNMATFYTKGRKYGTVGVTFVSEVEAIKYSTALLETVDWALLPIYLHMQTRCRG